MTRLTRLTPLALAAIVSFASVSQAQLSDRLDSLDPELQRLFSGVPVTLEQCVDVATLASTALGRFQEDTRSAVVDRRAALGAFLPDLSLTGFWQRQERTDKDQAIFGSISVPIVFEDALGNPLPLTVGGQQAFQTFGGPTSATEDVTILQTFSGQTLRTNWSVFSGFSRFSERNRANAALAASQATEEYQATVVRESVTNAYYDLIGAKQRVQVAIDAEELARQELERSETYFELGISTRSDVLQAKVRHQQTKLDTVRERNGERNAFAALTFAMGLRQAQRFEISSEAEGVENVTAPDIEELLNRATGQRRDLAATRLTLDASESAVTTARAGFWPSLQVFASHSRTKAETPFRFGASQNSDYTWGVQGQWNIFDRFQTKTQTRRAVASRRKAEYDLRQKRLDIELEIVQLRNNLVEAVESHEVSSVTVEQSQEDLRLATERFRVGAGTSLDVITAQVNLAQARRDLVDAQINILKLRNQLGRAVGDGS
jgi:outer membrane protein